MTEEKLQFPHKLTLHERKTLTMTGVTEIVSFDETAVILHTALGTLVVQGRELRLHTLSPEGGQVAISGNIGALHYQDPRPDGGWLRRILG